ncbi:hypothetical protein [Clostridium estertheticum]|uniref:hypothetical protein n=1 Tax=Clostridium estertheticum TaxID=238834 RepID=UPI001C0B79D5|nr:hypothetical protein [Clostridium estertheticum]MBU3173194.1 hypothetical protein [Clostridium estertheticum]
MKSKSILLTSAILAVLLVGCNMKAPTQTPKTPETPQTTQKTPKVITATSMVSTPKEFEKAISKDGIQTINMKKSLTINKELVVNGEFRNDKALLERKINLYSQDKVKNIGDRFTLAVPKLIIKSTQTSMEHGNFKGDLYISANNFQLIDTKVEGNVYFTTPEAKNTCKMDAKSKVTGKQESRK